MRALRRGGLVAVAALLAVAAASAATPTPVQTSAPTVVEAGGATYPDKAYILTLPVAEAAGQRATSPSPRTSRGSPG